MGDRASDGIISTQAGVTGVGAAEASAAAMPDTVAHVKDQNQLEVVNGHKLDKSDVDDEEDGEGAKKDKKSKKKKKKDDEVVELISIRELFSFADGLDRILIIVGTIAAICNGLAQPLMTLVFGQLINAFGQNTTDTKELVSEVGAVALRFVYIGTGSAIAAYIEVAFWIVAGERQAARIRSLYLRQILRQDISFFDQDTTTGEVIARMSGDTILIQDALGEKVGKLLQLTSTFFGGYVIAFIKSWKLTLVMLAIMPIIVVTGGLMSKFISQLSNRGQNAYAGAGSLVEQIVGSIRTVTSYTGEQRAVKMYDESLKGAETAGMRQGLVTGAGFGFLIGTMFMAYGLALWYGGILVRDEGLTGGQVINVIFAVLTGAMSLGQTSPSIGAVASGRAAAFKMFQVIKRKSEIDVLDKSGVVPEMLKGDVELRNVDFHYPMRPDVQIFSNFNLFIPSGKTVALVGESGSGKSTVIALVERFYDPQSGQVLIDGLDIKSIQLRWLREHIGLVSQEPVLFGTSIKENISYGKEGATMEEIEHAAALANAAKFIMRVPQGYDTLVGERGIQLSGGQKQRVAIARAILKNPQILLLDEATSALDAESERVVQEALDRVMTNRTTVVVAHRLTTIRNADMIAVVQRGVIVETGSHNELIQKPNGAYSQLVHLQEFYGKKMTEEESPEDPDFVPQSEQEETLSRDDRKSGSFRSSFTLPATNVVRRSMSKGGSTRNSFSRDGSVRRSETFGGSLKGSRKYDDVDPERAQPKKNEVVEVSILRLAQLNRPELPLFLVGSIGAACSGLTFPVFGLLLSSVITAFFEPVDKMQKDVNFWAIMFVVLGVGVMVATPVQQWSFAIVGHKLIRRIRRLTFQKILQQEINYFDQEENSSGAIGSRLSGDASAVRSLVGDALSLLMQNLSTITAGLVIAFTASWQLALIVIAAVPLLGVQGYVQIKWMQGFAEDAKVLYEDASRVANDAVSSIRTVASFCAEDRICSLYEEKCQEPVKTGTRQGLIAGMALGFSNFVMFSTYALCFWAGGKLVDNGTLTFKQVFRVFFAITLSAVGVTQTAGLAPDFTKVKTAVNSIFKVLDRKSEIDPYEVSGLKPDQVRGEIGFQHVSFFYPTRPDVQIFQDLCFKIPAGQTMALVGESGSGKSTVISLIERFYNPQAGVITVDGADIKTLNLKWLRQQIGLVSQEPVLFNQSIAWNIRYGREGDISEDEVVAAATSANAHRFISALPDGYKTKVGERGAQLSGGQKQRVAIARAILKDPRILLLDEATSALDAESEHVVQEALDRIMVDRTTVVVAHRLSTIRNADIIGVVKNGVIVEQGRHDDLIARPNGAYASLVKLHMSTA
ncbi:autophagy-related protein 9 [Marchantia polymorpha subsp. ruderalis]|uniref:Uncharacterized protein n=2 Tax=Marchantia polymorpha TaxID=3197 RepID=A0A176VQ48_MARPO|nr:hypothetical protein AXG93_1231s1270 [Marchantia polymorpha subsp. ruderalis]PTQ36672.1 hypothetical protein MARPO_0062s0086 [Marchantia polymorpha]BBN16210.1 hypothetical protein Mp_7g04390 [Marchantia polymorpha subsp. ruderalis]|eukprot:PTQ36672.1 hypothetical protein MARPO_0062s0086 [Marchantia polymorpha]